MKIKENFKVYCGFLFYRTYLLLLLYIAFIPNISKGQTLKTYEYDSSNRLIKESHSPSCNFITYTYDADNNRLSDTLRSFQINAAIQNIDCSHPNGSITLTPASPGAFSYVWSTGATASTVSVTQQGVYTVNITESNFGNVCSKEYFVFNTSVSGIASINHQNITCNGLSDGWASVTIQNPGGSYIYQWSNGQTADSIYNLPAGTYSVTVTDTVNNCVQQVSVQIIEPNKFITGTSLTNATCGLANGNATVNTNIGSYLFNWSNGQTTQTATNLLPGQYFVTVTNQSGCIEVDSVRILSTPLISSLTISNITCHNSQNGSVNVVVNGNPALYTFIWSNGQQSQTINSLDTGIYFVTVTEIATGCQQIDSVILTQPNSLYVHYAGHGPNCFGDSSGYIIADIINGGTPPYYFSINSSAYATDSLFTNLSAGNYQITLQDSNGCLVFFSTVLTQPQVLSVAIITLQNETCIGQSNGSVIVSASGGNLIYYYSIDGLNYQTSPSFSALSPGNYYAYVKDNSNCADSLSFTINSANNFILSLNQNNVDCFGNASGSAVVQLSGNPIDYTNVHWSNGQTGIFASGLSAGNYIFYATDSNLCTLTDTVVISQPPALLISGTTTNVSCDSTNDGSFIALASGGVVPYSFSIDSINYQSSVSFSNLSAGNYTFYVKDSNDCINNTFVSILQNTPINGLPVNVIGDTLLLSPYSAPSIWYAVGNTNALDTSNQFICSNNSSYYVTGIDSNGCIATSDTVQACISVGNFEVLSNSSISIFPNPNFGLFTIRFGDLIKGKFLLSVFDTKGRKCYERELSIDYKNFDQVDLSHFAKANYTITIKGHQVNYQGQINIE